MRTFSSLLAGLVLAVASEASAQFKMDADCQGYTSRFGDTVIHSRSGVTQTYNRIGNMQAYSDSTGTNGFRTYSSIGRYDSYSNPSTGRSSNGFYPYQNQYTYPRIYSDPAPSSSFQQRTPSWNTYRTSPSIGRAPYGYGVTP